MKSNSSRPIVSMFLPNVFITCSNFFFQVDVEEPDFAKFPKFASADYQECILREGQMLYIPPYHWHYVRSLSLSFSVSFWWKWSKIQLKTLIFLMLHNSAMDYILDSSEIKLMVSFSVQFRCKMKIGYTAGKLVPVRSYNLEGHNLITLWLLGMCYPL